MARWDEILTLPVQSPPALEFSSTDIVWSRVEGWKEVMDRVALIPFSRVNDFVKGESNRNECPTKFHVEARRRRPPEMSYKPKVDGILEYILYWCSFGPDDHRKGGVVRPSRHYTAKRKTPAGRPNTKRGCTCHFIVKRLIAEPTVALIIYNHEKHVDKQGLPCHGPMDKKAVGTCAMFAPYISEELRLQLMSLIYVGVPVETIMQRHIEAVENQGGPRNRDDLLTHRYVRRLERKIRRSTYELDMDESNSLNLWIESHQAHVFFYEDYSHSEPFILGLQTEWQLQQMIHFGNRSLLVSDSSFGTNKLKCPVHSLLVFDSNNNGIPVAWIITPKFASNESHRWLRPLYDRVHSKDPNWKLGGFVIDDPSADITTIREVFQCSVLICYWRMRHAWHKNIMRKCTEAELRAEMFRRLGEVISTICKGGGGGELESFESFMEDFVDCSDFLDYFKGTWFPRLGPWAAALENLPVSTVETCAAIECYHHQLMRRLLNEKDPSVYQRTDWLVDKLATKVHSYYWLDEFTGKASFARYWKDEWKSGITSWHQALQIEDSDVIISESWARVNIDKNEGTVQTVWNPGSEFALCDCDWSKLGNLCKHIIKACILYHKLGLATPSMSRVRYNQILSSIFHCPPHDSLFRDHAIALSISVKTQLDGLFCAKETRTTSLFTTQERSGISKHEPLYTENRDRSSTVIGGQTVNDTMTFDGLGMEEDCDPKLDSLMAEAQKSDSFSARSVEMKEVLPSEGTNLVVRANSQGYLDAAIDDECSSVPEVSKDISEGTVDNNRIETSPEKFQSQPTPIKSTVDKCVSQNSEVFGNGRVPCHVARFSSSEPMDIDCAVSETSLHHTNATQGASKSDASDKVSNDLGGEVVMNDRQTENRALDIVVDGGKRMEDDMVSSDCCRRVAIIIETDGCCSSPEKANVGKGLANGRSRHSESSITTQDRDNNEKSFSVPVEVHANMRKDGLLFTLDQVKDDADLASSTVPAIHGRDECHLT